jgi:hypothetical protein
VAKTVTLPNTMVTTFAYDRAQRLTNKVDIDTTATPLRVYEDGARRLLALDLAGHATAETAFAWRIDSSMGAAE